MAAMVFWVTIRVPAAIGWGELQTFDTAPPASKWATRSIQGAGSTIRDLPMLEAIVQTNSAADITNALPTTATVPPAANANVRWNSFGLWVQTRPAGNAATLLKATLTNNTSTELISLGVYYEQNSFNESIEEVPGFQVFYSMDGSANSWVLIPELSGDITAGPKWGSLDLSGDAMACRRNDVSFVGG
jgi:hypothetical protein